MSLPTPLELRENCEKKYGFPDDDTYFDLYQIFTLYQTKNISLLYPDNATKIFTHIYNNDKHHIFEHFIDDICTRAHTAIIYITTVDDDPIRTSTVKQYIPNASKAGYTMKKIPVNKRISINDIHKMGVTTIAFIFEYSPVPDSQFGHYGVAVYNCDTPDILCIFDSMMNTDADDTEPSTYSTIFTSIMKDDVINFDYLGNTDPRVTFDLYRVSNPNDAGVYAFELTGGALEVPNAYIDDMSSSTGNKQRIYRYIHCSDNQNQFCYMWVFLYLTIKLSPQYERMNNIPSRNIPDFITFHKSICDRKIIPLTIIKTFAFHTFYLDYIRNINIIRKCILKKSPDMAECFFMKYFRTFTALDSQYPDSNTCKTTAKLFEISNLNPIHHAKLRYISIFDVIPRVIASCDTMSLMDITHIERVLSHNPFVFDFVDKQLALAFSRKKSIYKFITNPSTDNVKIDMNAFNTYANEYDDIIDDETMRMSVENFNDYMTARSSP